MTDMVEKVARALELQAFSPELSKSLAQVVLTAIEETHAVVPWEPTEAMLEEGAYLEPPYYLGDEEAAAEIYKAMISVSQQRETGDG